MTSVAGFSKAMVEVDPTAWRVRQTAGSHCSPLAQCESSLLDRHHMLISMTRFKKKGLDSVLKQVGSDS
jgi:hypothetical protein